MYISVSVSTLVYILITINTYVLAIFMRVKKYSAGKILSCGILKILAFLQTEFLNYLVLFGKISNPKINREVNPWIILNQSHSKI